MSIYLTTRCCSSFTYLKKKKEVVLKDMLKVKQ